MESVHKSPVNNPKTELKFFRDYIISAKLYLHIGQWDTGTLPDGFFVYIVTASNRKRIKFE